MISRVIFGIPLSAHTFNPETRPDFPFKSRIPSFKYGKPRIPKNLLGPSLQLLFPLHCRLKIDNPTLTQTTTLFGKQIVDEAAVFITCDQACFFSGKGDRQRKRIREAKTTLSQLTVFTLYFRSFPAKLQFPFYVI